MTEQTEAPLLALYEAVRKALIGVEMARTDVVNPVNGARPYSFVTFAGARIEFQQLDCEIQFQGGQPVYDAATGKAAEQAQRINDLLFDVAKRAATHALTIAKHETEPAESRLSEVEIVVGSKKKRTVVGMDELTRLIKGGAAIYEIQSATLSVDPDLVKARELVNDLYQATTGVLLNKNGVEQTILAGIKWARGEG